MALFDFLKKSAPHAQQSKRIPDDVNVLRLGSHYVVNADLWKWVNPSARRRFDEAQQFLKARDVASAASSYVAAIELEPGWYAPHFELGSLFLTVHEISDAIPPLRRSIEIEPSWAPAYFNLAQCCKFTGQFQAAIGLLIRYVELDPTDPEGFYAIGCIYMNTGDTLREDEAYRLHFASKVAISPRTLIWGSIKSGRDIPIKPVFT